jgi:hypothetical protein
MILFLAGFSKLKKGLFFFLNYGKDDSIFYRNIFALDPAEIPLTILELFFVKLAFFERPLSISAF